MLCFAQATQRHGLDQALAGFRLHGGEHVGVDGAGSHRASADVVASQLFGPHLGQGNHPGLGGGVVALAEAALAGQGRNVDDHPFLDSQFQHFRSCFAATQKHAGQVHVDHRLPLLQAHLADYLAVLVLHQQAIAGDAGVIDQAVQAAEVRHHVTEQLFHFLFFGHVGQIGARFTAGRLTGGHGGVQVFLAQVHAGQAGALAGKVGGNTPAQATAGAGNNNHFLVQIHGDSLRCRFTMARIMVGCPCLANDRIAQ